MTSPFRRRPDPWSAHERARTGSAARLDGPIDPAEDDWLNRHLAECGACRAELEAFEANRHELRALRRQPIEPPRDLWARTAATIEREARPRGALRRAPFLRRRRPPPAPLGAFAGLLVIAVVFGATLLSGRPAPSIGPLATPVVVAVSQAPDRPTTPLPTPILVTPAGVDWVALGDGGRLAIYNGVFSQVCEDGAQCAPIEAIPTTIDVPDAPTNVLISPDDAQLVLVGPADGEGGSVIVVPIPTADAGGGPDNGVPSDPPSEPPAPTPTADVTPDVTPETTPEVTINPSDPPSELPTEPPASATPSGDPFTPPPSIEPSASAPAGPQSILDAVIVVGQNAGFSADGTRLAFSARPADGSYGPDIYVWTVGAPLAIAATTDHRSVFAGWLGNLVLGSRAVDPAAPAEPTAPAEEPSAKPPVTPSPSTELDPMQSPPPVPVEAVPQTFIVDPASGATAVVEAAPVWRPAVYPLGQRAVYWEGTLVLDATGAGWLPGEGRLVVGAWPGVPELPSITAEPGLVGDPGASDEPDSSVDPFTEPSLSPSLGPLPPPIESPAVPEPQDLADGPVAEWEARWDETGTHLAVWIADGDNPSIGKLSLYVVDSATGIVDVAAPLLSGEFALPGFTIGEGHVAWVTAPDQNGVSGSHVKIAAWTEDGIGRLETQPGQDVVVIKR